jgi:Shugoshin C terminus
MSRDANKRTESTNTDPVSSPLKITKSTLLEDMNRKDSAKKAAVTEHSKGRDRRPAAMARPSNKEAGMGVIKVESEPAQVEPETPCPPDLLSPVSSQPSTARPISRDTPPPPDLGHSSVTADGLTLAARATRRPRASVNYAEPNLRDKMRRPTKELVDAVTGEGKGHRMSGVKMEGNRSADESSSNDKNQIRTVVIKRERDDGSDQSWKKLPPSSLDKEPSTLLDHAYKTVKARENQDGSPLNSKSGTNTQGELPNSIITQRRRRTSTVHQGDGGFTGEQSASAAALSEMRKKTGERGTDTAIQNAVEKLQALDIYDFKGSSSPTAGDSAAESSTSRTSHRRSTEDDSVSDTDALSRNGSSRRGGRRQTLVGNTQVAGDPNGSVRTTRSVANLDGSKGNMEGCVEGGGAGIGGRTAGRRRSMML